MCSIAQHRARFKGRAVPLDGEVDDSIEQRVAWSKEIGADAAVGSCVGPVKRDALIPREDRCADANLPVPVADVGGHMGDLVAASLPGRDPPAKPLERGE